MPVDTAMNRRTESLTLGFLIPEYAGAAPEVEITGIAYDSRQVRPGDLFFALSGLQTDGARFAADAVAAGARAVVCERPLGLNVPCLTVGNARRVMAEASHRFFGHPDRMMDLVGFVGTNGKSTAAAGLQKIWECAGVRGGLLGTVSYSWGSHTAAAERTTPEAPDLDRMLARMYAEGVTRAAIEVSSHALALDRVWGLGFRGGVFTNLSRDHLDYHKTFERYRDTKKLFFERLAEGAFAAINLDDPAASDFRNASRAARIIGYSVKDAGADVFLEVTSHSLAGTGGRLIVADNEWPFVSPLWGEFNHSNLAAIAAAALGSGLEGGEIVRGMAEFGGVPGRAERVRSGAPFAVYVDFAHTPEALNAVLSAVRPLVAGRLLVVFGCGGDRDHGKRPEMAQAVERWADGIYLTSDNPRTEDPLAIIEDAKTGFGPETLVRCDSDRARAIIQAVADAGAGDVVLLCGKGHEETQDIAGVKHRFSDRDVAAQALAAAGHPLQAPEGGRNHPNRAVGSGGDPSPVR